MFVNPWGAPAGIRTSWPGPAFHSLISDSETALAILHQEELVVGVSVERCAIALRQGLVEDDRYAGQPVVSPVEDRGQDSRPPLI